jgi:hypothetical protein
LGKGVRERKRERKRERERESVRCLAHGSIWLQSRIRFRIRSTGEGPVNKSTGCTLSAKPTSESYEIENMLKTKLPKQ